MNKPLSAKITFEPEAEPQLLQFHTTCTDNPWRFLADDTAVELVPVCDSLAQTVPKPPLCDRLEIWPVRHGFPPSLIKNHPDEVEKMRLDHHAGLHDLIDGNLTWDAWLNSCGIFELWLRHHTPEMSKQWINCDNVISDGSKVFKLDGQSGSNSFTKVRRSALQGIHFRADFHLGMNFQTVYLAVCIKTPLTTGERKLSPGHVAREDELIRKRTNLEETAARNNAQGMAVAAQLKAAAKEVTKATGVADLYANPSLADAKNAAITRGAPKEFVQHCLIEMHVKKFPSTDEAFRAVHSQPIFRALRDPKVPSRSTVWRWLSVVRKELERRGLLQPRGKVRAASKAAHSDLDNHGAPADETTSKEEAEQEKEQGGRAECDPDGDDELGGDLDPHARNSSETQGDD